MRTKTLLMTAALTAAGVATSMAQVYSVNAVGYVNKTVPANGLALVSNPLIAQNQQIKSLFASVPDGTIIFKYNPGSGFLIADKDFGEFSEPAGSATVDPGEGVFIRNPTAQAITITFVGEVPTGPRTTPIPAGLSIVSSQIPQAGTLTDLLFPAAEGDIVYKWNPTTQAYSISAFDFGSWEPAVPTLEVGEAVFVQKAAATNWTRTFNVNQ